MNKRFSSRQKAALIGLLLLMAASAGYLVNTFVIQPAAEAADMHSLQNVLSSPQQKQPAANSSSGQIPEGGNNFSAKFQALQRINSDIKGWITVPGTNIDYPVLQSSKDTPDYYLTHTYKKEKRKSGSIYLQSDCSPGVSRNAVVYGHHMLNGSMFSQLERYDKLSYFQQNRTFQYMNSTGVITYEIFAVLEVTPEQFSFNRTTFADDADFARFLSSVTQKSIYQTGVSVTTGDQIMTLATCSDRQANGRTVVFGKKSAREGGN